MDDEMSTIPTQSKSAALLTVLPEPLLTMSSCTSRRYVATSADPADLPNIVNLVLLSCDATVDASTRLDTGTTGGTFDLSLWLAAAVLGEVTCTTHTEHPAVSPVAFLWRTFVMTTTFPLEHSLEGLAFSRFERSRVVLMRAI